MLFTKKTDKLENPLVNSVLSPNFKTASCTGGAAGGGNN